MKYKLRGEKMYKEDKLFLFITILFYIMAIILCLLYLVIVTSAWTYFETKDFIITTFVFSIGCITLLILGLDILR
jgi:hypothetical protein